MKDIIIQLIIRLVNSTECTGFYMLDSVGLFDFAFDNNELFLGNVDGESLKDRILLVTLNENNSDYILSEIGKMKEDNIVIACSEDKLNGFYPIELQGKTYYINLFGKLLNYTGFSNEDVTFKVLAIVHFYNEEDVIQKTTEYLLSQQVDVYLIDNWSEDASYEIAKRLAKANPEHVFLERFPADGKKDYYDWYHQLRRTEEISKDLDYDWFIHYDADEMRVGPWKDVNLRDTIRYIDSLGYNLIENTVIDFKITDKEASNNFMTDCWFDFGRRAAHFEQVKTWKKSEYIDLKSSGGHMAVVNNPRIFPLKILNRHYPLRSVKQAVKKVLVDRKPRFVKENKERGWHNHYNALTEESDFVNDTDNLILWNERTFDEHYIELFTGCGIIHEEREEAKLNLSDIPEGARIVVYGAGGLGKSAYKQLCGKNKITHWVDRNYKLIPKMFGKEIESPEILVKKQESFDYVVIAVKDLNVKNDIEKTLKNWGIDGSKVLWSKI